MKEIIPVLRRGSFHVGGEKTTIANAPVEDYSYMGSFTFHSDPNGTHWTNRCMCSTPSLPVKKGLTPCSCGTAAG